MGSTDIDAQVREMVALTGADEATVRSILTVQAEGVGEAVGVVRFDPVTKSVAHRVMDRDVVKWRVSHPTDGVTYEMVPTKADWELLGGGAGA